MNRNIIEQKYPKSYELLKTWLFDMIRKQGMKEEVLSMFPIDSTIGAMLSSNIRQLYDFFDKYETLMIINVDNNKWRFITCETNIIIDQTFYNSRKQAEEAGFEKCFEILEKNFN